MRCLSSVLATCRSRNADVISAAWLGTTRKYRLLNQHDFGSYHGASSTTTWL